MIFYFIDINNHIFTFWFSAYYFSYLSSFSIGDFTFLTNVRHFFLLYYVHYYWNWFLYISLDKILKKEILNSYTKFNLQSKTKLKILYNILWTDLVCQKLINQDKYYKYTSFIHFIYFIFSFYSFQGDVINIFEKLFLIIVIGIRVHIKNI